MAKKLIVEFIGTFFIVLVLGCMITGDAMFTPLAVGLVLMGLIYAGGHISGAHYNPAVSIAFYLRGTLSFKDLIFYSIAQYFGGIVGAVYSYLITDNNLSLKMIPPSGPSTFSVISSELLTTFVLTYVILNVATTKKYEGNSFFGIAIAATIIGMGFAVGNISGGAFNPAVGFGRAFGDILMDTKNHCLAQTWHYFAGPIPGAIIAAIIYNFTNDLPIINIFENKF